MNVHNEILRLNVNTQLYDPVPVKVGIKATDLDLLSTEAMKVRQMNLLTSSNVIHELNQIVIIYSNLCLKPVQLLKLLEQIQFTNIYETRPKPAYGRQGLDWIVWLGYSFVVFSTNKIMETNQKT